MTYCLELPDRVWRDQGLLLVRTHPSGGQRGSSNRCEDGLGDGLDLGWKLLIVEPTAIADSFSLTKPTAAFVKSRGLMVLLFSAWLWGSPYFLIFIIIPQN